MLRSSYDVVIIGTDLPGLVFGALAAKKGYRVLVLGHGGQDNIYDFRGFQFVRRPHLLFGVLDSNPIREVFRELALAPEMRNLPRPMNPICHVVLPDARVELTHMKGILEEEIQREFPGKVAVLRDFLSQAAEAEKDLEAFFRDLPPLPPGTIREWWHGRAHRKVLEAVRRRFREQVAPLLAEDPRLRSLVAAPLTLMSGLDDPLEVPLPALRLVNHLFRGFHFVEWGLDSLKALFVDRVKANSGDVRPQDSVDMMLVRRGEIREVELRGRQETIGANLVVLAGDQGALLDLIPEEGQKKRYRQKVERLAPSHHLVTVNVGVDRDAIPEGMAQTAFVVGNPREPLEGPNLLCVQVDPAMQPLDMVQRDQATIAISGRLPAGSFDGKPSSLAGFGRDLLQRVQTLMPFLEEHTQVSAISSVGIHPRSGDTVVEPAGLVPFWSETHKRSLGLATWPLRTAYRNVLFLGEGAAGPLGFEGAFIAGLQAFQLLKEKLPLKSGV
ncbi:MAG TPA: hypothetical protein PLQ97_07595 [Myxococcota bacterium]|nr:hypothetical protein [Myxococcota bacterium]HQK50498.1 hypothetical protein [Myxococcota bacterium]